MHGCSASLLPIVEGGLHGFVCARNRDLSFRVPDHLKECLRFSGILETRGVDTNDGGKKTRDPASSGRDLRKEQRDIRCISQSIKCLDFDEAVLVHRRIIERIGGNPSLSPENDGQVNYPLLKS